VIGLLDWLFGPAVCWRGLIGASERMYRIQDPVTRLVDPFNKGMLFGSVEVFLFILSIGGLMTVVFATGALDLVSTTCPIGSGRADLC
jgi:hypothetical protein